MLFDFFVKNESAEKSEYFVELYSRWEFNPGSGIPAQDSFPFLGII
jgi:hypothetical protein